MTTHIFGIRHHGPGSARSLLRALHQLQPDCILVEGPPDADGMIPWLANGAMEPPVALLVYVPDDTRRAAYYPFASFSPEYQALCYALHHEIPVQFMDLPQKHVFALTPSDFPQSGPESADEADSVPQPSSNGTGEAASDSHEETLVIDTTGAEAPAAAEPDPTPEKRLRMDPLRWLAEAAGYADSERWWEHMVEQRLDSTDLFDAILEAMTALREHAEATIDYNPAYLHFEALREAHMRKTIRAVERKYERVTVICGAWHAPALANMPAAKHDNALLKGLPKVKTEATWVPWTHGRLARMSGYGAGIESPGWYAHLWQSPPDLIAVGWMTHVAHLLRDKRLDASPAQVIDAVRLSETLAALRDRPVPGLPEMNEATQTVFCFGSALPMQLIERELIVGEILGAVPEDMPMVPLQRDFLATQKRLRLKLEAEQRERVLDLRKDIDLQRSQLLHRLALLGIHWGQPQRTSGIGTFKEGWVIAWQPEFAINVIEASIWGNTVYEAASAQAIDIAAKSTDLPVLTNLLDRVLKADLPDAARRVMKRVEVAAALASDVVALLDALPDMARVARYSDVRQTDTTVVESVIDGLVTRICIGLPGACASLDDTAAAQMFERVVRVNAALNLLQNGQYIADWQAVLAKMMDQIGLHGLLAGRFTRILLDADYFAVNEGARRMRLSLSNATEPADAANWVEGFLSGSGLILLHDDVLWNVLDEWVASLRSDTFKNLLPLLRRTFATFSPPERRQMGQRARHGTITMTTGLVTIIDVERADRVLPLVVQLLGLNQPAMNETERSG